MDLAYADLPEGYKLHVKHLHPDNSSRKERLGSKYRTIASIIEENDTGEVVVAQADARCSKLDVASRQQGWHIAVGRAKAQLLRDVHLA